MIVDLDHTLPNSLRLCPPSPEPKPADTMTKTKTSGPSTACGSFAARPTQQGAEASRKKLPPRLANAENLNRLASIPMTKTTGTASARTIRETARRPNARRLSPLRRPAKLPVDAWQRAVRRPFGSKHAVASPAALPKREKGA